MEIIIGGRQTGKTTKLIEMAAEAEARGEQCYIVCQNHRRAYAVAKKAKEMGLNIGFPLTYDEFLQDSHGLNIKFFYIDDAEQLIRRLSVINIAAITINKDTDA